MQSHGDQFMRSLGCYLSVYISRCCTTREIKTKITISWATQAHTLLYMKSEWVYFIENLSCKHGQLHSEATDKADILNKQFKSAFTPPQSAADNIPKLSGPKTPLISPLKISTKGVEKLLAGLNVKKASGPDNIPCKILLELAAELARILTTIFQQSLETGQIPDDWTVAFVYPIFKKGNRNLPVNYRSVSLTSVPCKIMEHIICSHVRDHLDKHSVLTSLQHGFREAHSCETRTPYHPAGPPVLEGPQSADWSRSIGLREGIRHCTTQISSWEVRTLWPRQSFTRLG